METTYSTSFTAVNSDLWNAQRATPSGALAARGGIRPRACAACGARHRLRPGDDAGYISFCDECLTPLDLDDPYVELGGSG